MPDDRLDLKNCALCGRPVGFMGYMCRHCSKVYCGDHRMPENHKCPGKHRVTPLKEPDPRMAQPVTVHNFAPKMKSSGPGEGDEAPIRSQSGEDAKAISARERAVQNPEVSSSWINKGMSRINSGDLQGAASAFRKVIELGPYIPMQYQNLATVYLRMNQPRDAVEVYQKLTRSFPRLALGWVQLGEAHLANHDVKDAKSAFRKARELAPEDSYIEKRIAWSERFIRNDEISSSYDVFSREESFGELAAEYRDFLSLYEPESPEKD